MYTLYFAFFRTGAKLRNLKQNFCLRKGEIPALHAHIAYKYESKVN